MKYLLLPYLIPWAFLGLYGDITLHTAWLYLPAVLVPISIGWYLGKSGRVPMALAGNLVSAAASFLFTLALRTDHWNSYFKPFGGIGLMLMLWLIVLLIQALIWRHYRKDTLTFALLWCSALLLLMTPSLYPFWALI